MQEFEPQRRRGSQPPRVEFAAALGHRRPPKWQHPREHAVSEVQAGHLGEDPCGPGPSGRSSRRRPSSARATPGSRPRRCRQSPRPARTGTSEPCHRSGKLAPPPALTRAARPIVGGLRVMSARQASCAARNSQFGKEAGDVAGSNSGSSTDAKPPPRGLRLAASTSSGGHCRSARRGINPAKGTRPAVGQDQRHPMSCGTPFAANLCPAQH